MHECVDVGGESVILLNFHNDMISRGDEPAAGKTAILKCNVITGSVADFVTN